MRKENEIIVEKEVLSNRYLKKEKRVKIASTIKTIIAEDRKSKTDALKVKKVMDGLQNRLYKRIDKRVEKDLNNPLLEKNQVANTKEIFKTMITTFNGQGAMSEALKLGNYSVKNTLVCEINKNANDTYYANNKYIAKNHTNDINDLYKNIAKNTKVDLLLSSPECQSFSAQGARRGFQSISGNLFLTSIKLAKKIDSNILIWENVKGLITHEKIIYTYLDSNGEEFETRTKIKDKQLIDEKLTLIKTIDASYKSLINKDYKNTVGLTMHIIEKLLLKDKRYNYYWKIINTLDQGLPQNRERIFIVGIKKELDNGFKFPENKEMQFTIEDILEKDVDEKYFYKNDANHILIPTNQKIRKNKIHTVAKYSDTMTYESTRRIMAPSIAPCITTGNTNKFLINNRIRVLTPTENKLIHGFRKEFKLVGSKTVQNRQLGNTVSPLVYKYLLDEILKATTPAQKRNIAKTKKIAKKVVKKSTQIKPLINPKNTVLYSWAGSKRALTDTIQDFTSRQGIQKTKFFIDAFGGSMAYTINNIAKFEADIYIINDIDKILATTYKAVKDDYKQVQDEYIKIRDAFYTKVSLEFRKLNGIKKDDRIECFNLKKYYQF